MLTLGFDTSTGHISAALVDDGNVVAAIHEDLARGQAEKLLPMIIGMLETANATFQDIDRIGVGIGPGNFTGIRISVATARGLAMGRGIPAIGISTNQALVFRTPGKVRTVLDARREHVYLQDFNDGVACEPVSIFKVGHLPDSNADKIIGAAAELVQTTEQIVPAVHSPGAGIALIAETSKVGAAPSPLYVRPPDAAPPKDTSPLILDA